MERRFEGANTSAVDTTLDDGKTTAPRPQNLPKSSFLARCAAAAALGCALLAAGAGFDAQEPTQHRVPAECEGTPPATIVLVTIDGVRWQDIYEGSDPELDEAGMQPARELTPNLHALADRGVALGAPGHGATFSASGPNFISLPGYTELLTGQPARCLENDCTETPAFTLLDAFVRGRSARKVATISSWDAIEHVAASKGSPALVSAGRNGGFTRDSVAGDASLSMLLDRDAESSPIPGHGDYRADEKTVELALRYLGQEKPAFAFVSLGDTDEHAHAGNYAEYLTALRRADDFVGSVMQLADGWKREGRETVIVVTTDHGRSADFEHHGGEYPESARTWLVAAGGPIPARGFVDSPEPRYLRDIAPTLAAIGGVPFEMGATSGTVLTEVAPTCTPS